MNTIEHIESIFLHIRAVRRVF